MAYVFLNGTILPEQEAHLSLNDLGVLRGYGVCEVLRTTNRIPFLFSKHLERLNNSCINLHINLPFSLDTLAASILELIALNIPETEEASIKVVITGGISEDGIHFNPDTPTVYILVKPFTPLPQSYFSQGIHLLTQEHQRFLPETKSLGYLQAVMAQPKNQEANALELLYHSNGELRETSTSNIFLVKEGVISTPSEHILKGITRSAVLDILQETNTPHQVRPVLFSEIETADEIFITASNKDVLPVTKIDHKMIGTGIPGPYSRRLLDLYRIKRQNSSIS